MTIKTESGHNCEYFVSEANDSRSRDAITLKTDAAVYLSGTVLMDTAGVHERFDGAGTAVAILYHDVDAIAANAPGVAHTRDMEYKVSEVIWNTAVQGEIDAATTSLAAAGMIARATDA